MRVYEKNRKECSAAWLRVSFVEALTGARGGKQRIRGCRAVWNLNTSGL